MLPAAYANATTENYTDNAREQMQMLNNPNSLSPTYLNEMGNIQTNFDRALGTRCPKDLPLLVAENKKEPGVVRAAPPPSRKRHERYRGTPYR